MKMIMNKSFAEFSEKLKHISSCLAKTLTCLHYSLRRLLLSLILLIFQLNPFWVELGYFITVSSFGFLALKAFSRPRTFATSSSNPRNLDLFFTSVSATTVSSMSTVEMEVLTNPQLIFLTILMFLGGEVFTSVLGLQLMRAKMNSAGSGGGKLIKYAKSDDHMINNSNYNVDDDHIELGRVGADRKLAVKPMTEGQLAEDEQQQYHQQPQHAQYGFVDMKLKCVKSLAYLVSLYLVVVHAAGTTLISIYLSLIPSARNVLETKGLHKQTFSIFTAVSTFANCGFVPSNENMMVFKKDSGLLLILIPLIVMGNTLFPVCLRLSVWFLEKMTKREEFAYMLRVDSSRELGYGYLLPGRRCGYLALTALGFIVVQFVLICSMAWKSEAAFGLTAYEKLVAFLFQVVNSRHAGESVIDLSRISQAVLVLFVVMMYLPPHTCFLPTQETETDCHDYEGEKMMTRRKTKDLWEHILFSQLTYLAIFVVLICITEREKLKKDTLNFNVFNIVFEVISAYGNVGITLGYSCEKQQIVQGDGHSSYSSCKDTWYGFVGRWSDEGKIVLIIVMFFGRLKKFNLRSGGRGWHLC